MKNFMKDFKDFVLRGNVIDLAVAVVLGAAFKAIIDAVVNNIFNPVIGVITGGLALDQLSVQVGEVVFQYGLLISAVINFLIIALLLFIVIRVVSRLRKAKEEEPTPDSPEVATLKEIRELLKAQNK